MWRVKGYPGRRPGQRRAAPGERPFPSADDAFSSVLGHDQPLCLRHLGLLAEAHGSHAEETTVTIRGIGGAS